MVIGLTGGIGTGKTTVAKIFEIIGCAVFYSDQVAKEVYYNDTIKEKIVHLLGQKVYQANGTIDKKYISSKIFSNTDLLNQLNDIIHPAVIEKFEEFKKDHKNKMIVKESALLFEAGLTSKVDKIVLVVANDETRIARVMLRDALLREEVVSKIQAQMPQNDKISKSDFVIYNNEEEFLITQVVSIYSQLKNA